jgi:alanine racemase
MAAPSRSAAVLTIDLDAIVANWLNLSRRVAPGACDYHFDLTRPGAALYGVAPVAGHANPMRSVVRLQARLLQVRDVEAGEGVGYNYTWQAGQPSRVATVSVGLPTATCAA